ncbi:hypothetical protein BJX76DRAFT_338806 [Aspergillus varians]
MTEAMDPDSPGLQVITPNLKPRTPTPPPFAIQGHSPRCDGVKSADKNSHKSRQMGIQTGYREATAALLQTAIAPYHPELWRQIKPLKKLGESDPRLVEPGFQGNLKAISQKALGLANSLDEKVPVPPRGDNRQLPPLKSTITSPGERVPPNKQPKLDHTQSSPLTKFLITAPESRDSLPALRDPSTTHSPDDSSTILPPIQTQLNQLGPVLPPPTGPPTTRTVRTLSYSLPSVTVASPPLTRVEPSPREPYRLAPLVPPKIPPSAYSHLSPASSHAMSVVSSPVSQQTYWRSSKPPSGPYPYDPPSTASTRSPASNYPTPIERASTGTCDPGGFTPSSQGNIPSGPTGTFKCSHPGCTAAPFQTQYLLNSHANVHSQDRPHFCPIDGCSRGPGGKGFKRKNEMIRHGLVHNSPGYVCPFCPDQQHKYPRPDNLQRHVRVHHVDKNKDDPALRHVLAQRPEGSGRGRRRRINPQ